MDNSDTLTPLAKFLADLISKYTEVVDLESLPDPEPYNNNEANDKPAA